MRMTPTRLVLGVLLFNVATHWVISLLYGGFAGMSMEYGGDRTADPVWGWHNFGFFHWSGRVLGQLILLWFNWEAVSYIFVRARKPKPTGGDQGLRKAG